MTIAAATELTKKMMKEFSDRMNTVPTNYLSSFFGKNSREIYISDSKTVEIDIERGDEKIAVDVKRGADGNLNLPLKYTTKLYEPPFYNEFSNLNADQLNKRLPGQSPYEPVNKRRNMLQILFTEQFENSKRIMRAIELQAAQALFSGKITLKNADELDFNRKSTHNITPVKKWDDADGDPIADLAGACRVNRIDGKVPTDIAFFGTASWDAYSAHPKVRAALDNRRITVGEIKPKFNGKGAVFQGFIWVGDYRIECYTYDQYYEDETGTTQQYVPSKQVVCMYSGARLNKSFGAVNILTEAEQHARSLGFSRVPSLAMGKFIPYSYTIKESNLVLGVQSAPILIPTQIDAIANINTLA